MLRWAILGSGFISRTVVGAIDASPGSEAIVVAGRDPDRVEAFRAECGIARGTTDLAAAIASSDVDAVYVGLPNHVHHEVAIEAAAAGKAILSEKSLTTTMPTAYALADAVRDRVFFAEGLMYLAHPLMRRLVEVLRSGRLGTVRAVTARYSADIAGVVNPSGGGTIYNLGCYPVSLLHLIVQTAGGDAAFGDRRLSGVGTLTADGTVGHAAAAIEFGDGTVATVHSTDEFGMGHDVVVMTDRGELRFETNPWLPVTGSNELTWMPYDGEPESIVVDSEVDAFDAQIRMVEDAVAAGRLEAERPSPRLDDSLEIMGLLTEWEAACRGSSAGP